MFDQIDQVHIEKWAAFSILDVLHIVGQIATATTISSEQDFGAG